MPLKLPPLPQLLHGETVTVIRVTTGYDEHMDVVETEERETVDNVLVAPGSTAAVEDSTRPYGTRAVYTLGFPKTYNAPLRGCRVEVRGGTYGVIGDPQPNSAENCPTAWWYTAEVEAVDG